MTYEAPKSYTEEEKKQNATTTPSTAGVPSVIDGTATVGVGPGVTNTTQQTNEVTGSTNGPGSTMSYDDLVSYYSGLLEEVENNNAAALRAQKKAIEAGKQQAIDTINTQKETTEQEYADTIRQLYLNKMANQKNIGQQMAAAGQTGGQAESTLLGINTAYDENLRQSENAKSDALKDLEKAIANAEQSASIEAANAEATAAQNKTSDYVSALNSILSGMSTIKGLQSNDTDTAYTKAVNLISYGVMPDEDTLNAAGLTTENAQAMLSQVNAAKASSGSGSGSGSGSVAGKEYTSDEINFMVEALNKGDVSVLPELTAATGMTETEAINYAKYLKELNSDQATAEANERDEQFKSDCLAVYNQKLKEGKSREYIKAYMASYIGSAKSTGEISDSAISEATKKYVN